MPTYAAGTVITILTRTKTGTDGLGNDTFKTPAPSFTVRGAYTPGGSTELVQGQEQVITQPTAYLPYGTPLGPLDALIIGGVTFEVDGSPNNWGSPFTGRQAGLEVKLKAVTG